MRYLSFILLLLLMVGCKKEDPTFTLTFQATVVDPISNQPVSGANVAFRAQQITDGVWSSAFTTLASGTTDGNGVYTANFEKGTVVEYRVEIDKSDFFSDAFTISGDAISTESTYTETYSLYSEAYLNVRIVNSNPFDANDEIRYQKVNNTGCSFCCSNTLLDLDGENIDTTFTCPMYGGTKSVYNWFVTKNGNLTTFSDSVVCTPADTTFITISY